MGPPPPPPAEMKGMHPSVVSGKVNECLANAESDQGVVIYINMNPDDDEKIMEGMEAMAAQDERFAAMKLIFEKVKESENAEDIKRFCHMMMACNLAKYADNMFQNMSQAMTHVAFGHGEDWWFVDGSATMDEVDWDALHEKVKASIDFDGIKSLMEELKDVMPAPPKGMRGHMGPRMGPPGPLGELRRGLMMMDMDKNGDEEKENTHMSKVADCMLYGMISKILGEDIELPTEKPDTFADPIFSVLITMDDFNEEIVGTPDIIVDVEGHYSAQESQAGNTEENVFIAAPPKAARALLGSLRLTVCKRYGGL